MVKDIEDLKLKLCLHAFGYGDVLEKRRIREVFRRAAQGIQPDIAEGAEAWPRKRAAHRSVVGQRGYRRKEPACVCVVGS